MCTQFSVGYLEETAYVNKPAMMPELKRVSDVHLLK